jgi:hypothetical protein
LFGPLISCVVWMWVGLAGRFEPWADNIHIVRNPDSYIIKRGRMTSIRKLWQYEKDQQAWLKSGMISVFLFILIAIVSG